MISIRETFQVPNLKTGTMEPLISALSDEEDEAVQEHDQADEHPQAAKELDVRCMVDAEQTYSSSPP